MENKKILMTGGLGFIGSNFINYLIDTFDSFQLINFDYHGIGSNRKYVKANRANTQEIHHIQWDISYDILKNREWVDAPFDYLFHFAAESHVDRSISTPEPFVRSNVMGTMQMLELARKIGIKRVVAISTDEIYGSVNKPVKETAKYNPSSVYSATKASAEMLCNAYKTTYGMDIVITRCGNNYGPNQFEEKLIPKVITNALNDKKIPVYDKGEQIREWVYVEDHVKDILFVAEHGKSGEIYNVGHGFPITNLELVKKILKILDKSEDLIEFIPNARKGHDFKYSLDLSKIDTLQRGKDTVMGEINVNEEYFNRRLNETIKYYQLGCA
jgi:dTDP-glucose 4,6-dehydratase